MRSLVVVTLLCAGMLAGCISNEPVPEPDEAPAGDDAFAAFPLSGALRESPYVSFEPTLGVDEEGAIFLSIFGGSLTSKQHVARSTDHGLTWADVTPAVGPVNFAPNSNDPYVHVDQDTGRVFNFDMHALVCMTLSWSDDQGESWTHNPAACGQPVGGQDHQTFWTSKPRTVTTVGYDSVLHYCVNRVADVACAVSLDGGLAWSPLRPVVFEPCVGIGMLTGHGVSGPDGRIYIGKSHCGRPTIAVSEDDGLTWDTVQIADVRIDGHDVNMGTDSAGNVYATWRSQGKAVLSVSTDFGRSWSEPLSVTPDDVTMAEFMVVEAGDEGRAAVAFYGTSGDESRSDLDNDDTWDVYLSVVLDATGAAPQVDTTRMNAAGDPVARGPCDDNNRCRGVGDFIDVVVGADGRPWVAVVDTCREDCIDDPDAGTGGVRGAVGTLASGPALRGDLVGMPPLLSAPAEMAVPETATASPSPPSS